MTKTLIIGAHGKVGQQIVQELDQRNQLVLSGFREENQIKAAANLPNVLGIHFDLTMDIEKMSAIIRENDVDKIVFTAGAGGQGGLERTVDVDLDGAIKTMVAANQAGVNHYVMVSAAGADDRQRWSTSGLYYYFMMKHYADYYLQQSSLTYTIVRPTVLVDTAGTGRISLSVDFSSPKEHLQIPRADVAAFIAEVLENPKKTAQKVYEITTGQQVIKNIF